MIMAMAAVLKIHKSEATCKILLLIAVAVLQIGKEPAEMLMPIATAVFVILLPRPVALPLCASLWSDPLEYYYKMLKQRSPSSEPKSS
jgi:hypothetical protein